ncbi:hypothetical protein [Virgibacillus proomii]|uniref:hypothetical protein n=1 Tax=Virgibacillus proomii TaxID=84407 RepID=UPI001C1060B2|nr:hypothetical protein [Virgibacillus proomii]MBU5268105.1 hypothetical protein [Virgibacillus proomii]
MLDEIDKQSNTGVDHKITKKITFNELAMKWLDMYKLTGKKDNTIETRLIQLGILNKQMAKIPIDKITHLYYQNIINGMSNKYERNSLLAIHSCAGLIFKFGVKYKLMAENPAKDIVIPKKVKTVEELQKDSTEKKYREREELETFLEATKNSVLKISVTFS